MRGEVVLVLILISVALAVAHVLAESENQRDVEKKAPTYISTYNETRAKKYTNTTRANGKEKKTIKDPLLIIWIVLGIAGFLITTFIAWYCLLKYGDCGEQNETSESQFPEQPGNKQALDVEVLQTLQEEGQVVEFLQMLEESSRKSLERNLGPPRKEDFGSDNQLHGSGQRSSYIVPQELTACPNVDGSGPPPYNISHVQSHLETPFYNYGFEDEESSVRSELGHAQKGYYGEMDDGQWDRHCGEMKTGQTHRRLWYEDSINECNNNNIFTVNRLERSCVENDENDQQQQYLDNGHSYSCNTGIVTCGSADKQEHAQFCEKVYDIAINSQHGTGKDSVIEMVTVKSEYIQQNKGNVVDSLSYSNCDRNIQNQQEFDKPQKDFEEELDKNNQKRANDLDEFDDVEFGASGHAKRIRSVPERAMVVTHAADNNRLYRELLRGSIAALAIANGATDVPLSNDNFKQEKNKVSLKDSAPLHEREKKRSFESKEYGFLVNEQENGKANFGRQSVLKRISKKRKDSRQRFKESSIEKQTRTFSKKVVKGLSKVKSKAKSSSSKQSPTFVVASL